jgi:hypothetical protein
MDTGGNPVEAGLLHDGREVAQQAKVHRQSRYPDGIGRAQQVLDAEAGPEVGWKGNRHQTRIRSPNPERSGEARSIVMADYQLPDPVVTITGAHELARDLVVVPNRNVQLPARRRSW